MMTRFFLSVTASLALLASSPADAHRARPRHTQMHVPMHRHAAPATIAAKSAPEPADAELERAKLNAAQAETARQQMAANAAARQAHDDALAAQQAQIASQQAAAAKAQAEYDAAKSKWEADTAACKAGNKAHCAPAAPAR